MKPFVSMIAAALCIVLAAVPAPAATTAMGSPNAGDFLSSLPGLSLVRIDDSLDNRWYYDGSGNITLESYANLSYHDHYLDLYFDAGPTFTDVINTIGSIGTPHQIYKTSILSGQSAGTFVFGLSSFDAWGGSAPSTYFLSDASLNYDAMDHMVTYLDTISGDYFVGWEDLPSGGIPGWFAEDIDYNDFIVRLSGVKPVPVPPSLLLLCSGMFGLLAFRSYKRR